MDCWKKLRLFMIGVFITGLRTQLEAPYYYDCILWGWGARDYCENVFRVAWH